MSFTELHLPPEPLIRGLPLPDPRSLCRLSSTEFVEPPSEQNSWVRHCMSLGREAIDRWMMGGAGDLDNDDGESLSAKNLESALHCLSLFPRGWYPEWEMTGDMWHLLVSRVSVLKGWRAFRSQTPKIPQRYGTTSLKCKHKYFVSCIRLLSLNDTLKQ